MIIESCGEGRGGGAGDWLSLLLVMGFIYHSSSNGYVSIRNSNVKVEQRQWYVSVGCLFSVSAAIPTMFLRS